jgi:hypothetical protein
MISATPAAWSRSIRYRAAAVAVLQPFRDEMHDVLAPEQLEAAAEDHGRRHAVDARSRESRSAPCARSPPNPLDGDRQCRPTAGDRKLVERGLRNRTPCSGSAKPRWHMSSATTAADQRSRQRRGGGGCHGVVSQRGRWRTSGHRRTEIVIRPPVLKLSTTEERRKRRLSTRCCTKRSREDSERSDESAHGDGRGLL